MPAQDGYNLMFRHAMLPRDEMKTWVDTHGSEGIFEAARHPVYRVWEDKDKVIWLLAVEFTSLKKDSPLWLTFRNAFREVTSKIPASIALGDLTSAELATYLQEAD